MPRPAVLAAAALALAACGTSASRRPPPAAAPVASPATVPASPPRPEVLLASARALRAQGDETAAQERLEAAYRAAPGSDEVRLELADLLVSNVHDLSRAAELLAGVHGPRDARAHLLAARLAELRGDDPAAADAYAAALAASDDADVHLRRALVLERLGRNEEATRELERVKAVVPEDPTVRGQLADKYEAAGRLADAEAEFRAAAEARPDRLVGWVRLAHFYERIGRRSEAAAAQARAREADRRPARTLRPLLPSHR